MSSFRLSESFNTERGVVNMEPWIGADSFPATVADTHDIRNGRVRGRSCAPDMAEQCLGRVVDILEASGAFDPGSSPGRGVRFFSLLLLSDTTGADSPHRSRYIGMPLSEP